jgi:glycosyltransferase involved in cell wall biosynthesis
MGGPLESVRQSSLVLVRRGHHVEVVSLDRPDNPWSEEFPGVTHALGPGRGKYGYSPRFVPWLKERRTDYDAVIVHGVWQYSSFAVWRALRQSTTPYFVFPHGMLDPWFNRTYPLKHVKKLLYWPWAEYRVLRDAAAVLFTTEKERVLARESFRLYRCREVVVNFGTAAPDVNWPEVREIFYQAYPSLREVPFLLFLGRLHEKKGCEELIRAFAAFLRSSATNSRLQLVLAGPCADSSYLQHLQHLTKELFASAESGPVIFTGLLTGNPKWGAFAAAEAFILPSHQENFGIAIVEALASGIPVLISDQVNIWHEIVTDGCGYAEHDDLAGTRRLLEQWQATPATERAQMSTRARACFANRFEINQAVDSFLRVVGNPPDEERK